ncbi:hypothetical protein K438DRAFT_949478 [Mycena galopus ATCC 62051]|nr:hypothetical protein K438DRAFT_949478 [Mycena galopus ATCC 62051]
MIRHLPISGTRLLVWTFLTGSTLSCSRVASTRAGPTSRLQQTRIAVSVTATLLLFSVPRTTPGPTRFSTIFWSPAQYGPCPAHCRKHFGSLLGRHQGRVIRR